MKKTIFTTLAAMLLPLTMTAQDDMYFTPTKAEVKAAKEARKKEREAEIARRKAYEQARGVYYSGLNKTDDEYNRRVSHKDFKPVALNDTILASTDSIASDIIEFPAGNASRMEKGVYPTEDEARVDTVYKYIVMDDDDYRYSRLLSRYDDFYFWHAFHDPFYNPWYYNPWYYGPRWSYNYYAWSGWYDPWYGPGWDWYDPWYHPWHNMGWVIPVYPSYRPAGNAPTRYAGVHRRGTLNTARGHNRNSSYAVANRNGDRTGRYHFNRNTSGRYDNNSFNNRNNWNNNNNRPANRPTYSNGNMGGGSHGSSIGGGSHSGGSRSAGGFGGRGGGRR